MRTGSGGYGSHPQQQQQQQQQQPQQQPPLGPPGFGAPRPPAFGAPPSGPPGADVVSPSARLNDPSFAFSQAVRPFVLLQAAQFDCTCVMDRIDVSVMLCALSEA